jgi:phospholipid/cholesterol/gamma-HCH transport system permease protein
MGVVLSMHTRDSLIRFGAEALQPTVIIMSIIQETGPIITALVVSGRVAAGIGAELGSMKVTEQIDAIEASAVNPFNFLVATRVIGCICMLPLVTLSAVITGVLLGWVATTAADPISFNLYWEQGTKNLEFRDFLPATFRTAVFGLIIGLIGCFQGIRTKGGTVGVGRSATGAVVFASLFVIVADVLLVRLILIFFR